MERISIFNYEAFYLDFLEGNLNEEDTLLLKNFLALNPDLDFDIDEVLPEFNEDDIVLDDFSKLMLKSDFEAVEIDEKNISYFVVAETEGLLSENKLTELNGFIGDNSALQQERKLANAIVFKADMNIVYDDKEALKQKRRIVVLWPYASAIAAASIVFFFYWILTSPSEIESNPIKQNAENQMKENQLQKGQPAVIEKNNAIPIANNTIELPKEKLNSRENQNPDLTERTPKNELTASNIDRMKRRAVVPITYANEQELAPIQKHKKEQSSHIPNNDESLLTPSYYVGMHNPIEPLTKFVTKKTNTEVDFKTTKKAENERRGFYLKIGKFEISRNRRH